jgi:hypothetical protein
MSLSFSSLNPLSLVSNAVESVCDAVLPKNLEFIGDVAGLIVDLETGNYVKCLEDSVDLLKDLPQQAAELTKNKGGAAGAGGAGDPPSSGARCLEPTPPPPYSAAPSKEHGSAGPAKAGRTGNSIGAPVLRGTPPKAKIVDANKVVANAENLYRKAMQPPQPDHGSTAKSADAAGKADKKAPEISSTGNGKTKEAEETKSAPTTASTSMSPDEFFKLSDKALMDAVRDGKLPDSVKNDPDQMRRLQVRMQDIAQMNTIITSILNTMHEMNKAIIQNLRV